jgi:octaprenyl-diphosphate synthase
MTTEATAQRESPPVLRRLVRVAETRGLDGLAEALSALHGFVSSDLYEVEALLDSVPVRDDLVGRAAQNLLDLKGKRLRPLCVALSARVGGRAEPHGLARLAAAVELTHSATLLHDDVVDAGDLRRGKPTSRVLYGNAASVFAGDWLLVQALMHVQSAQVEGLMDRLLRIIDEMIEAESVQLEHRGVLRPDRGTYFHIIEGKTAALFRWAMIAGGRAGGLDWERCEALGRFGNDLGMAFQIVDDALDLSDSGTTGKSAFTDLKEGKLTYPLLVGLERDPALFELLQRIVDGEGEVTEDMAGQICRSLTEHDAIETTLEVAQTHADQGRKHLEALPECEARVGLELVADVAVRRPS